jgi:hypothetical protein
LLFPKIRACGVKVLCVTSSPCSFAPTLPQRAEIQGVADRLFRAPQLDVDERGSKPSSSRCAMMSSTEPINAARHILRWRAPPRPRGRPRSPPGHRRAALTPQPTERCSRAAAAPAIGHRRREAHERHVAAGGRRDDDAPDHAFRSRSRPDPFLPDQGSVVPMAHGWCMSGRACPRKAA